MTPYTALLERSRADPAAPMLTYRDLATGERMELSAASLANAVAKTAGMLRDELDAEPGAIVGVHLPLHWQRVVWLGACAATGTIFAPEAAPDDCDVLVVDRPHLDLTGTAREDVVVSLAPFGLPEPGAVPTGVIDAAVAMRGHPDTFVPFQMATPDMPLLRAGDEVIRHGQIMEQAAAAVADLGVGPGQRFAVVDPDPLADVLGLAGPLATGGAVVLVSHPSSGDLPGTLAEEGLETTTG
jgi:uncharacterized protein (TIGR03089 family)